MAPALGGATPGAREGAASASPAARAWQRFRRHRRGYISLWIFGVLFGISLFAGVLSNDRPLLASYQGQWYTPLWHDYPETTFGGDFLAPTEWHDPFIQRQFAQDGNWALWPLNRYSFNTLNYYAELPNPAPPSAQNLLGPTLAIAFLGAIESLLCARVADGMTHDRHDPNQELMAQGIANFATPLFGGIAVTGTIARTVTNIRSGAHSPIAGLVHALTLLVFMLLLAPLAVNIPMSVLAGILLFVGFNMGDWRAFARLRRFTLNYRTVLLTTFCLTVVFDLTVAVQFGLLLASFFFIYRVARVTRVDRIETPAEVATLPGGRRVGTWQAFGSIFFGSISKLEAITATPQPLPDIVVLDLHRVINMDTTGLDALQSLHRHILEHGDRLVLCAANRQPLSLMKRAGFLEELGDGNLFDSLDEAYAALRGISHPA